MRKAFCLILAMVMIILSGCTAAGLSSGEQNLHPIYKTFRDIPGVTQDEIDALEDLLAKKPRLVYGFIVTSEAFLREDGSVGGFAALLCNRMSELLGFEFDLYPVAWEELIEKIQSKEIDLTGDLTPTPERLQQYLMTEAIAQRTLKMFTCIDAPRLDVIARDRPLRCAFLDGSTTYQRVADSWTLPFEPIFIEDESTVPGLLLSGELDIFIEEGIIEASFDDYDYVKAEEYYPLTYSTVSLASGNSELDPIFSVMQKYIDNGGYYELTELNNQGYSEYLKNKLYKHLSDEEKEYILRHNTEETAILVACEVDNYPTSFYNTNENEFQGIALDTLDRISELTGLSFRPGNQPDALWPELIDGLESGEYSICTELLRSSQREGRFIWTDKPYCTNSYALLSKAEFPDVDINQILFSKIGLMEDAGHTDVFLEWFPDSANTAKYFVGTDEAFAALDSGEIDLLMANENMLLNLTNYQERSGYKANFVFNYSSDSLFGFNKDEELLRSVINKALNFANSDDISSSWQRKVFDYQSKMLRDMIPYTIAFSIILLAALFVVLILFIKNRRINKNLEKLVLSRTNELAKQTRKLEVVVKNYSGVIWSVDNDMNITLFDGLYLPQIGVTPDFLEGKPLSLARQKNRHLDIIEMVEKTLSEGPQDCISEIDGEIYRSHTSPIKDENDKITGVVGDTINVTESVRMQAELKAALEMAESASKAKGDFLSRMSHEIRTPLNAIIGMINIAMGTEDNSTIQSCLGKADNASKHLLGVINDILDMSKIEADKFELDKREFNFEKMLMNVTNVTNYRTEEKKQTFIVNLNADVPESIIGDDLRFSQVITNLLTNAVKFTPEHGTIVLSIHKIEDDGDEVTLKFEVEDNGIGISEEQQKRLFTSFEQADGGIARRFGGTGLGLAISKRIVELMGGRIWIESEMDKGSKFIFTAKVGKGKEKTRTKLSPKISRQDMRILAVDDSPEIREYFTHVMESLGLPCDVAGSGAEAIEMVASCGSKPYNIFFIDWQMPEMNGIELTRRVKEKAPDNSVVFMISAAEWSEIEKEALAVGVRSYISKPLFPSTLVNAINECLEIEPQKPKTSARSGKRVQNYSGHTILIAEDVEINREIISAVLEETKLVIDFAENGSLAVKALEENPGKYSLVLMDIQMPEMDGYEATRRIRALDLPDASSIPIIAMTANVFREDIENCLAAGMNDHVGKPVDKDEIFARLEKYLPQI